MSGYEIFASSVQPVTTAEEEAKYPFAALQVGQSFAVPIGEITEGALRVAVSRAGKKLSMKFKVKAWPNVYEVARIE